MTIGIREEVACFRLQDNKKSEERNALEKRVGLMGTNTSLATSQSVTFILNGTPYKSFLISG